MDFSTSDRQLKLFLLNFVGFFVLNSVNNFKGNDHPLRKVLNCLNWVTSSWAHTVGKVLTDFAVCD